MLSVGLTGGIGSGKSAVSGRLVERGAVLVDADVLAREVVAPGTPGLQAVVDAFGPDVRAADGGLDRERMAAVVFADPGARARLESLVHPLVRRRAAELAAAAPADAVVVHDVPLLVEKGLQAGYHLVVVVDSPAGVRLERLVGRRGMTPDAARSRIASQATDDERRAAADVLLGNTGTLAELATKADRLWDERLLPYEDNVRARRPVRLSTVELVASGPEWPAAYQRLRARLARVAGERALRIDHVGSTAVPGLAAKDVLDVQVTVASMADADALADGLAGAGFPRLDHVTADRPKPVDPDPARWAKRMHAAADPGRPAHVHLRAGHSAGWRYALLFRDWLRREPAERAAYEEHKRRLAAAHPRTEDYAEAKEPWFDAALGRAEDWAAASGWTPSSRVGDGAGD